MSEPKDTAKSPLSRWSERKLAARRGKAPDEAAAPTSAEEMPPPAESMQSTEPAEESEAPALPSIDELDSQSDYTAFLNENVPEALRRAALRKLWTSDPVLANLDGLNDYDDDYNAIGQVIGLVRSSYQAGRGYVDKAEQKLAQFDDAVGETRAPPADSQSELQKSDRTASEENLNESGAAAHELTHVTQQSIDTELEPTSRNLAEKSDK